MVGDVHIRDAARTARVEYRDVDVYIDGEKVDTLSVIGELCTGMTLESDAISDALQGRTVIDMFFTGEVVNVVTKPEEE